MKSLTLEEQDALRKSLPASDIAYQDGEMLISAAGVLRMADEIIAGKRAGNVAKAREFKKAIATWKGGAS